MVHSCGGTVFLQNVINCQIIAQTYFNEAFILIRLFQ